MSKRLLVALSVLPNADTSLKIFGVHNICLYLELLHLFKNVLLILFKVFHQVVDLCKTIIVLLWKDSEFVEIKSLCAAYLFHLEHL